MAAIKDVLAYLLANYPHEQELSNARVTKMIYLADWHHAINVGSQITPISWIFDNYGPFVWDVAQTAKMCPELFSTSEETNMYGSRKLQLSLVDKDYVPEVSSREAASIKHVIETTKGLYWSGFIRLVYSTYPIVNAERYSSLDLPAMAKNYKSSS